MHLQQLIFDNPAKVILWRKESLRNRAGKAGGTGAEVGNKIHALHLIQKSTKWIKDLHRPPGTTEPLEENPRDIQDIINNIN